MKLSLPRPRHLLALLACAATVALAACGDSVGPDDGGSGASPVGVWNRFGSAYGYETDVAFGGIDGEPDNRVYMCELPGSPSAGLYKGTLSDDKKIITWDAQYGLPQYEVTFTKAGEMNFFVLDGGAKAGQYEKGAWTGNCDLELSGGKLVSTARTAVIVRPTGMSVSSVRINGVSFPLRSETSSECTAANATTVPKSTRDDGQLSVAISYSGVGIDGPYSGTSNSSLQYYSLERGCNRLYVYEGCGAPLYCLGPAPAAVMAAEGSRALVERLRDGR